MSPEASRCADDGHFATAIVHVSREVDKSPAASATAPPARKAVPAAAATVAATNEQRNADQALWTSQRGACQSWSWASSFGTRQMLLIKEVSCGVEWRCARDQGGQTPRSRLGHARRDGQNRDGDGSSGEHTWQTVE